ncbi:hypothetical protein KDX27_30465 [Burkholderia cenocepacia]|uniref:baseplate hub protein n=1 Tax=Burkholderia cenocepacia TaxID=95486 RepID=UPI001B990340|nr:hypothetical protein [Burkholderia cenocepacia]MBR8028930.1 hypothetical protein [Burkholderia cenocepacia]MBR8172058.1 hypothetical protein [Burkholderia cenocepacia]
MSFTRKRIDLTITLGEGEFGDTGANTVTLTGLRVQAMIQATPAPAMPVVQARVYGLPEQMLNQLTAVGLVNAGVRFRNTILIAAGDDESMTTVYSGNISESWEDFSGAPDVALNVIGMSGLAASLKPVGALSYVGSVDVATIMQELANTMGLAFENNGVSVQLSNPYFPGTALAQARACATAADIYFTIDRNVLAIWPRKGMRQVQGDLPVVSPETGLIGYPVVSSNGITLSTSFNPNILPGAPMQVSSSRKTACGKWLVSGVTHTLESEIPDGQWFTRIVGKPTYV